MVRCQVSITHNRFYVVVPHNFLQRQDVPVRHHKVCSKRIAQNVGNCPARKLRCTATLLFIEATKLEQRRKEANDTYQFLEKVKLSRLIANFR